MPESIRWIPHLMPLHYYAGACYGVIFRGAGLDVVGPDLALLAAMGTLAVLGGALRFRSRYGVPAA